ncbi:zinc finger, CCHC-type containing protein, partial [Tanacetum coccineum]
KETGNGNVQRTLRTSSSGNALNVQCYNCNAKGHYARECPKPIVQDFKYFMEQMLFAKNYEVEVILSDEQNNFLLADAAQMEELEELSANICMMARIQKADSDSEDGPSYDSAFISEVQTPSTSFMNPLFSQSDHEQKYLDDIIFDDPNVEVNDGKVEHDKNSHDAQDNALELKVKKNEYVVVKMSNSVQAMFMLGPKPLAFYDSQLKHGLGYENPYTLKQAISENPKLYDASYLHSLNVRAIVCDTEKILEDVTKSQIKMKNKLKDPIKIDKKQNFHLIYYGKLNDLYETFVLQVELSLEQKYFSEASTSNVTPTNASKSSSPPLKMPKSSKMLKYFHRLEKEINKLHALLKAKTASKSIFFTNRGDTILSRFCYDEVNPILECLHAVFKVIQKEFPEDVQVMMNVFISMESDFDETLKENKILKD